MQWQAKWIKPDEWQGDVCPLFSRAFHLRGTIAKATLTVTAMGVYLAELNGKRVGDFIMAPGFTTYEKRLQYQTYDVTAMLGTDNRLEVTVGKGWYRGFVSSTDISTQRQRMKLPPALILQLDIVYSDGNSECITTDADWEIAESPVRFSLLYDGETLDATCVPTPCAKAVTFDGPSDTLVPQEGEEVRECMRIAPARIFTTPKGETVIDFGQNLTGYAEITVDAKAGEQIVLSHAEVLDKEGNFYTANYRDAKALYRCTCAAGQHSYKPLLTFYGFRFVRVDAFPGGPAAAKAENFTAIAVHSALQQTGSFHCSHPLLNSLYQNILWGQRDNYLDIPTDCPQRNERLGWTGDAQVFVRTACYNYDVEKFFTKWLRDMRADQSPAGGVPWVVPDTLQNAEYSAAWGDAGVICPWTIFEAYGNRTLLAEQWDLMKDWVDYITSATKTPFLWTGGKHFGDWLGLDAPVGSYKGSSDPDLIASAFYAYSTALLIKAGKALDKDVATYTALYDGIVRAFRDTYPTYKTQTECVLAIHFDLAADPQKTADQLAEMVKACGHLQTGFVGTPYLLHALSAYGHTDIAYSLLLREKYPSWLYSVLHGGTTMWEHWDSLMENGDFWSTDMNSFNHYAYGAVADWMFGVAAGIRTDEAHPGYEKAVIAPQPDSRLDWLEASLDTRHGKITSGWRKQENYWRFEITTPVETAVCIGGETRTVQPGSYTFYLPL